MTEDLIPSLVSLVDSYALRVAAPGQYIPPARRAIDVLIAQAEEDESPETAMPDELVDVIEAEIVKHTDIEPGSDAWIELLYDLADAMDDAEQNAND